MATKSPKHLLQPANPAPHSGQMLTTYIKQKRIYQNALARKLKRRAETIFDYKKRSTIQTAVLWDICHALNHNFFADIAAQLPPEFAAAPQAKDLKITELEQQVAELKNERDNLQKVIDILGKK